MISFSASFFLRLFPLLLCSFFYTKLTQGGSYNYNGVKRWSRTQKVDILSQDKVILPVHVGNNHWCLACINLKDRRFEYYDSLLGKNPTCLKNLRQYLIDEAKNYKKIDLDLSGWVDYYPPRIPRQLNGCDCGVFTLKFADYISEDLPLTFSQSDMPYFRRKIVLEILNKQVL